MDDDRDDPDDTWMSRFLAGAMPYAPLLQKAAAQAGYPVWRVEEREPGTFAVLRNGAPEGTPPDAVAKNRQTAYLLAATLTAMGGADPQERPPELPLPTGPLAEGDEAAARLLTQMLAKPEALELLIEATEPEVLRQAVEIAGEMVRKESGEN